MTSGIDTTPSGPSWWYSGTASLVSFCLALSSSAVLVFYPQAVVGQGETLSHGILSLVFWGIAAGYVHGIGYQPVKRFNRWIFHPLVAWTLIPLGLLLLKGI